MFLFVRFIFPACCVFIAPIATAQATLNSVPVLIKSSSISIGDSGFNKSVAADANATQASSYSDVSGDSATNPESTDKDSAVDPVQKLPPPPKPDDYNRYIYYRNRLEFSEEAGVFPINIPFPFDFLMGDSYGTYPLKYILAPAISSLRWHIDNIHGPMILRGNWEVDASGAFVWVPSGPETRYLSFILGMRRNFVPRNWKATPYWDWRAGIGNINAKGPLGIAYAQGEDLTFTLNMGAGVRYNFSSRTAMTVGVNWMHISNANLSQGAPPNWGVRNYGINVLGPLFGIDIRLRKPPSFPQ
jgi:hypothetical protein